MLGTVDLLVLIILDQLNFILKIIQWVETNPSNINKHPYFPYEHLFLLPYGTMLTAFDTDVHSENTDVRWVGFHPLKILFTFVIKQVTLMRRVTVLSLSLPLIFLVKSLAFLVG